MEFRERRRDGDWGWPIVERFRLPAPGDVIELPDGERRGVREVSKDGLVGMRGGGHLCLSPTCDGLVLRVGSQEEDDYRIELIDEVPCLGCGAIHAHWRVREGENTAQENQMEKTFQLIVDYGMLQNQLGSSLYRTDAARSEAGKKLREIRRALGLEVRTI